LGFFGTPFFEKKTKHGNPTKMLTQKKKWDFRREEKKGEHSRRKYTSLFTAIFVEVQIRETFEISSPAVEWFIRQKPKNLDRSTLCKLQDLPGIVRGSKSE